MGRAAREEDQPSRPERLLVNDPASFCECMCFVHAPARLHVTYTRRCVVFGSIRFCCLLKASQVASAVCHWWGSVSALIKMPSSSWGGVSEVVVVVVDDGLFVAAVVIIFAEGAVVAVGVGVSVVSAGAVAVKRCVGLVQTQT